jgi:hypothetical protein
MTTDRVVVLGSADSTLTLGDARLDGAGETQLTVRIDAGTLHATADVPITEWGPDPVEFFAGLAKDWRGWEGPREWWTEGLALTCRHDGVGHVTIDAVVGGGAAPTHDDWTVHASVSVEPGALVGIAAQFRRLLDRGQGSLPGTARVASCRDDD